CVLGCPARRSRCILGEWLLLRDQILQRLGGRRLFRRGPGLHSWLLRRPGALRSPRLLIPFERVLQALLAPDLGARELRLARNRACWAGGRAGKIGRRRRRTGIRWRRGRWLSQGLGLDQAGRLLASSRIGLAQAVGQPRALEAAGRALLVEQGGRVGRRASPGLPGYRGNLAEELITRERVRPIGRTERLVLDLTDIDVPGAVLPLQIEVFANRVVEYAHDARPGRLEG